MKQLRPIKPLKDLINQINLFVSRAMPIDRKVKYSVEKYRKTYELLEEYDSKAANDPAQLAHAGRLRPYIQKLQKNARASRRAHTAD